MKKIIPPFFIFFCFLLIFPQRGRTESIWAETSDGRKIHIFFIKGQDKQKKKERKYPVVLCHGIGAEGRFWYFHRETSLAYYLAELGFDVFVPDLRGVGKTSGSMNFSFEDYIKDVEAILKKITLIEGVEKVHWVGHSMGGMVIYLTASRRPELISKIASFTAVASPYKIWAPFEIWKIVKKNFKAVLFFLRRVDEVPFFTLTRIFWLIYPLAESIRELGGIINLESFVWNVKNVSVDVRRKAILSTGGISSRVLEKFVKVGLGLETFRFYLLPLTPPSLFIAGVKDFLATPPSVKLAYIKAGAEEKKFRLVGVGEGFGGDYGHVDIVVGKMAKNDVFPIILSHIERAEGVPSVEGGNGRENGREGEKQRDEEKKEKTDSGVEFTPRHPAELSGYTERRSDYSFLLIQDFGLPAEVWETLASHLEEKRFSFFFPRFVSSPDDVEEAIDEFCSEHTSLFNIGVLHGFAGALALKIKENCFSAVFMIGVPIKNISSFYGFYLKNGGAIPLGVKKRILGNEKIAEKTYGFFPFGDDVEDILESGFWFGKKQKVFYILSTGSRTTYWWDAGEFMKLTQGKLGSKFYIISQANMQDELSHIELIFGKKAEKYVIPIIMHHIENLIK